MAAVVVGTGDTPAFEHFGSFEGDHKWNGCAVLADGRVVFAPLHASTILIFNPLDKTWEKIGNFEGLGKWTGCAVLADGRVVFSPCHASSILIFNPLDKTWEEIGNFEGLGKWNGCAVLPDGRVVFSPFDASSILIFNPLDKTWEEIGNFEGVGKWNACAVLADGRVVFSPWRASSILIFNPLDKTWEEIGNFEGLGKWSGCAVLADGRVVFSPLNAFSILIFNPLDKTWEEIGNFEGLGKWNGCAVLPDGRVVFAPFDASSILIFNPLDKTWEEIGHFEGLGKCHGCAVLPDGRVVFTPCSSTSILVAVHASWHPHAQLLQAERQSLEAMRCMWENRDFTDAIIEAGEQKKSIPVHRAVLASVNDVFKKMFTSSFSEAFEHRVAFPEEPEAVEAVLEYIYTGKLPASDPLQTLPLAHRLGLQGCVAASAVALDNCNAAAAVQALVPFLGDPAVNGAWARLKQRISKDSDLMDLVLQDLVLSVFKHPSKIISEAAVQTDAVPRPDSENEDEDEDDGRDGADSCADGDVGNGGGSGSHDADDGSDGKGGCDGGHLEEGGDGGRIASDGHQSALKHCGQSASLTHSHCHILHCNRTSAKLLDTLEKTDMAKGMQRSGMSTHPDWAHGATVLVEGLSREGFQQAGHSLGDLRPWNIIVKTEDLAKLKSSLSSLRSLPCRQRPRIVADKTRRLLVACAEVPPPNGGSVHVQQSSPTKMPMQSEPMWISCNSDVKIDHAASWREGLSSDKVSLPDVPVTDDEDPQCEREEIPEMPAQIDKETAASIQHERLVTFMEDWIASKSLETFWDADMDTEIPIRNTFIDYPRPCIASPRTAITC